MKHLKLATICLGLALTAMAAADVEAGWFKKSNQKPRTEKTEEMQKPARFDHYPAMQFMGGVLTRDAHSGWKIGETQLYVAANCVITSEGSEEGWLEEGREAVVMGSKVGDAISAWSIQVSRPEFESRDFRQSGNLKEPGANPNVGVLLKKTE